MTDSTLNATRDLARLFDLTGRRALVIGAGSGIGLAACFGLSAYGAELACGDLNHAAANEAAAAIRRTGGTADGVVVDIRERSSVSELLERTGTPDVLVVTPSINVRKRLLDMSDEEFERVLSLNLTGTFRIVRETARLMAANGGGAIVLVSSIRAQTIEPGQGAYAATKGGIVQLARTFAAELGSAGVRVNVLAPGVVETPLTEPIKANPDWYRAYAEKTILGRWAQADEMVGAILFLASDASSYVTGSVLTVDGGWTAADGRFTPPL